MKLVVASRNPHKLRELGRLMPGLELVALPGSIELPPETGHSFAANAVVKAAAAAQGTGEPAIADDSGIEAAALAGAPGVRSARFAGPDATDEENLAELLRRVSGHDDLRVAYVCALAYANRPGEPALVFEGRCEGTLALDPRGDRGFGYDPAFVPDDRDDGRTMGELGDEEKDAISHRGHAARAFLAWLAGREATA